AEEREQHRRTGAAAFDLARSYACPSAPTLWITVGLSGSGKSALARELARRLPAVRLASDEVRKELAGVPLTTRLEPHWYSPAVHAEVYAQMRQRAAAWLARGEHVILDAAFLGRRERELARRVAVEPGGTFRVVECRCPDALMRERLAERD